MKIRRQAFALMTALALSSCAVSGSGRVIDNELILKDNSGIISQIKIKSITPKQSDNVKDNSKINITEQKGIWLSYIDLNELFYQKSKEEFIKEFEKVCLNCKSIGVNTLYVHCRAFGDALYKSSLFERASTYGDVDYDPFEIIVDTAHENGLSVHAWVNPLRCGTESDIESADESFQITKWYKSSDDRLGFKDSNGHYWLDPAYDDVREFICDGIAEIIDNYNVDGIHFDDYFYPTTDESFDEIAFKQSGADDLKAWRTENINKLVKSVYKTIKSRDKSIVFGISPQGNIGNNYEYMYADVGEWCSKDGYIDYIVPQIYFGFDNSVLPFETCLDEWSVLVKNKKVDLIIGLAAYKIYTEEEFVENADILLLQINKIKKLNNYGGYSFYNYISLFPNDDQKALEANKHIDNIKKTGGR